MLCLRASDVPVLGYFLQSHMEIWLFIKKKGKTVPELDIWIQNVAFIHFH